MISLEKWKILTPLQKLPNNVGNLGKIIVATSFEWLPKVQKIVQSGHTGGWLGGWLAVLQNAWKFSFYVRQQDIKSFS